MTWQQIPCAAETRGEPAGCVLLGDSTSLDLSGFEGRAACVYLDPPYLTGETFRLHQRIGTEGWRTGKRQLELFAYSDRYSDREEYLNELRLILLKASGLLSDRGAIFVHVDTRVDAHVRLLMDKLFGERNFVNQIIWSYQSGGRSKKHYSRKHDLIFFYRKSAALRFDISRVPIAREGNRQNHMRRTVDENGRPCRTIRSAGRTYVYYDDDPVYPGDVWSDLSHLQQKDPQRTGYDTQKPVSLLNRIILPVSDENDLVCDLCAGSGTTGIAAAQAGRRFLLADSSAAAVSVIRRRLIQARIPFELKAPCGEGGSLTARLYPGLGFYDVCLDAFVPPVPWPEGISGPDGVDQWSVGFVRDGTFHVFEEATRSQREPELNRQLQLPMTGGTPAVLISDILGDRYCFEWRGEAH